MNKPLFFSRNAPAKVKKKKERKKKKEKKSTAIVLRRIEHVASRIHLTGLGECQWTETDQTVHVRPSKNSKCHVHNVMKEKKKQQPSVIWNYTDFSFADELSGGKERLSRVKSITWASLHSPK